jgi:hypothetical protein
LVGRKQSGQSGWLTASVCTLWMMYLQIMSVNADCPKRRLFCYWRRWVIADDRRATSGQESPIQPVKIYVSEALASLQLIRHRGNKKGGRFRLPKALVRKYLHRPSLLYHGAAAVVIRAFSGRIESGGFRRVEA